LSVLSRRTGPVQLGLVTENDATQAAAALGVSSLDFGDAEAQMRAILTDLNARGGLLGHRVELVVHDVKTADAQSDPSREAQAACADFTQDNRVVAAVNAVAALNNETLFGCMSKASVPLFIGDLGPHSDASFARHASSLFGAGVLSSDRIARALSDRLFAQHYFTGWDTRLGRPGSAPAKVGVLHIGSLPAFKDALLRRLAAHGIRDVVTFAYDPSVAALPSQMASAELQFAAGGVTHVVIEEAGAALFFLPAAENQHYRPRYGIQSLDGLALLQSSLPQGQFAGALGIGWSQYIDVAVANDPGDPSAATARCRRLMKQAGDDPSNRTAFVVMGISCDAVALLTRAASIAGDVAPDALRRGVESVHTSIPSTFTFALDYAPARHDGVAAVRDLRWTSAGFAYVGPRRLV
jgi:hypothetical protein